ncbi:MAG TPA: TetR/AcrR family transcriptional regulator [Solirubrobacteraceae bacterium]|nr:TetR/AcrR family transcriptional regulator [Solirubrobacteraceae bacterium]
MATSPLPDRPLRRDAELNRQRILEAAKEAFAEDGLAVTLDEIARRAGVGVGTVYRRFPDKQQLIDALFEERVGEIAALAEASLTQDDAWRGFVGFLEGATELHACDRGLKEVALSGAHGLERVARARRTMIPLVTQLVERAQAQGTLRPDVVATDVPLLQIMLGSLSECSRDVEPEIWRRFLGVITDGLRTSREEPTPLSQPGLAPEQAQHTMRAWRPSR